MMKTAELVRRLRGGEVVALPRAEFDDMPTGSRYERTIDTGLAGPIHVLHVDDLWAVVEFPPRSTDVAVRPLADEAAVDAFVADRLATYERMWDGCGCRPDYWGPWKGAANAGAREGDA